MVEITVNYEGQLRCRAVHGPSQNELITDAPADNMGKGEAFSPTDLVATALATCILTTIGIVAQRKGIEIKSMCAHVEAHERGCAPAHCEAAGEDLDFPATGSSRTSATGKNRPRLPRASKRACRLGDAH